MADRIRELRRKAGMTQEELAKRCHVTRSAVALWETENTKTLRPDNLFAAAQALGVDAQYLATGKVNKSMAIGLSELPYRARAMLEAFMELPEHLQVQFSGLMQSTASQLQAQKPGADEPPKQPNN